jgi:putative PIN family toxin of toxin-antitoxin system
MRVVVDTNVFISAALKKKSQPAIAVRTVSTADLLLKSTTTEREVFITLARPRLAPLIPPRFRDWLHELLAAAERVTITERITACRDPKDDKFLELAVNGHADLIVSGDADLLTLNPFQGIPIVTPADFVQSARDKSRRSPHRL